MRFVKELEVTYRRVQLGETEQPCIGRTLTSSQEAHALVRAARIFDGRPDESVWVIMLDTANRVCGIHRISEGGPGESLVSPVKIFRACILASASAFILVHNHPSNTIAPSQEDRRVTREVVLLGKAMHICCLDHLILANDTPTFSSFADSGLIADLEKGRL